MTSAEFWGLNRELTSSCLNQLVKPRIVRGVLYSLSFLAMLIHFYQFSARVDSTDPAQRICHHLFFLTLNLALPIFNVFRLFFGLPSIRIGNAGIKKKP